VNGGARHLATALLLAGLAACSATVAVRPADDFTPFTDLRAADFPGAAKILTGWAPPDDDRALRPGDAALFAVAMQRDGDVRRELLLLEVVGFGAAGRRMRTATITTTRAGAEPRHRRIWLHDIEVALRRFDAEGHPVAASEVTLFEEALRSGWWPDADPEASQSDRNHSFAMTMSLQNVIDSDPTLQDLLFVVVDKPSLFSIATHLGVKVNIQTTTNPHRLREAPPFDGLAPGATVAVTDKDLTINGSRVGAVARNADDPGRTAVVRLLATRRGRAD